MGCISGPRANTPLCLFCLPHASCQGIRELPTLRQAWVLRGAYSVFPACVGTHSAFSYLLAHILVSIGPLIVCLHFFSTSLQFLLVLLLIFLLKYQFLTFVFLLQPQRGRSMSVCVPHLPALPSMSCIPLSAPCTPPPALSAPLSPFYLRTVPEETFAEKLSRALESVLPMHSASPRKHRRSSLPSLSVSPVCVTICLLAQ